MGRRKGDRRSLHGSKSKAQRTHNESLDKILEHLEKRKADSHAPPKHSTSDFRNTGGPTPSGIQRQTSVFITNSPHKQLPQTRLDGRFSLLLSSPSLNQISSDPTDLEFLDDRARMDYGISYPFVTNNKNNSMNLPATKSITSACFPLSKTFPQYGTTRTLPSVNANVCSVCSLRMSP